MTKTPSGIKLSHHTVFTHNIASKSLVSYLDNIFSNFWCLRNDNAVGVGLETSATLVRIGSAYSVPTVAPDNSDRLLELRRIREPKSSSTETFVEGGSAPFVRVDLAATRNLISSDGGRCPHSPTPVLMSTILKLCPCRRVHSPSYAIEITGVPDRQGTVAVLGRSTFLACSWIPTCRM